MLITGSGIAEPDKRCIFIRFAQRTIRSFRTLTNAYLKTGIKRSIQQLILRSRLYAPLLSLNASLHYITYLVRGLEWCRREAKRSFGDLKDPAVTLSTREDLYRFLLTSQNLDETIDYLEFGVARGRTIKWWVENNHKEDSRFVGFDTFTGLPDDWGSLKRGHFTAEAQVPAIADNRLKFEKGMFQHTLDNFLQNYSNDRRKVVNLDADLYSSTVFVLTRLGPLLKRNDVLIFDEFLTWKCPAHEIRALCDFADAYRMNYKLLGAAACFTHVAVEVI